jgi:hypothetical protein
MKTPIYILHPIKVKYKYLIIIQVLRNPAAKYLDYKNEIIKH